MRLEIMEKYVSPQVEKLVFVPEGILCFSVQSIQHEAFTEGDEFTI